MSILIKQDPQAASFTNSQWFTRLCQEYNQSKGGRGKGSFQVSTLVYSIVFHFPEIWNWLVLSRQSPKTLGHFPPIQTVKSFEDQNPDLSRGVKASPLRVGHECLILSAP